MRFPRYALALVCAAACGDSSPSTTSPDMATSPDLASPVMLQCSDALADVYTPPANLPPYDSTHRGDVVRCAFERDLTAAQVNATLTTIGYTGPTQPADLAVYRILYRTERAPRADGSTQPGFSSARVYLPTTHDAGRDKLVVVAHGTAGEADPCAPSKTSLDFTAGQTDDTFVMELGLAGAGFAVVAPDYAGLGAGDPPVQGWSLTADEAQSVLDSTRAMAKLYQAPSQVVVVGHSQGGHVVLSAQALAKSYGLAGTLVGTAAFAPLWIPPGSWGAAISSTGAEAFGLSTTKTPSIIAFSMYYFFGHGEVLDGPGGGLAMFQPSKRDAVKQLLTTGCLDAVDKGLPSLGNAPEDFYDPAFAESVGNCDLAGQCSDATSMTWLPRFKADRPKIDTQGGPIVIWQGSKDTTVAPQYAQCGFDRIDADLASDKSAKATLTVCGDPNDDHGSIVRHHTADAIAWVGQRFGVFDMVPVCMQYSGPPCGLPSNDTQ